MNLLERISPELRAIILTTVIAAYSIPVFAEVVVLDCTSVGKICFKYKDNTEDCQKNMLSQHILVLEAKAEKIKVEDISEFKDLSFDSCELKNSNLNCRENSTSTINGEEKRSWKAMSVDNKDGLGSFASSTPLAKYDVSEAKRVSCRKRVDGTKLF